jgi:hypothetical protein
MKKLTDEEKIEIYVKKLIQPFQLELVKKETTALKAMKALAERRIDALKEVEFSNRSID